MNNVKPGLLKDGIVFCLVLFLLSACTQIPEQPIKMATNDWLGYRPMYLAKKLGYIKPKDLHLIELTSTSEVLRNFRNGAIDAAGLTLDEALLLKQDGFDVAIVLVMDVSDGGDAIIAAKDILNMQSLKGRRVGV